MELKHVPKSCSLPSREAWKTQRHLILYFKGIFEATLSKKSEFPNCVGDVLSVLSLAIYKDANLFKIRLMVYKAWNSLGEENTFRKY
jgi:hypothetical protein